MSEQVTQPAAKPDFLQSAKRTITLEAEAVSDLLQHLDQNFNKACELMLNCSGRVIVTGMGNVTCGFRRVDGQRSESATE